MPLVMAWPATVPGLQPRPGRSQTSRPMLPSVALLSFSGCHHAAPAARAWTGPALKHIRTPTILSELRDRSADRRFHLHSSAAWERHKDLLSHYGLCRASESA